MQISNVTVNDTFQLTGEEEVPWLQLVTYLNLVVSLLAVVNNVFIIFTVYQTSRLHNVAFAYITNLAVCDLMLGATFIFYSIVQLSWIRKDILTCVVMFTFTYITTGQSTSSILLISVERFVAIKFGLYYYRVFTRRNVTTSLVTSWSITIVLTLILIYYPAKYLTATTCDTHNVIEPFAKLIAGTFIVIMQIGATVLYSFIFHISAKQRRRIAMESCQKQEVSRLQDAWRLTKTMGIVLLAFYLFWGPAWLLQVLQGMTGRTPLLDMFTSASLILGVFNSSVNFGIYALKNKEFKRAAKETLIDRWIRKD